MSRNTEPGGDGLDALASAAASLPVDPPPALRDRILASKARPGRYGIFADRIARLFDLPLADAESLMKRIESPSEWKPFLAPGTELIPITPGAQYAGATAALVRIQPGTRFPEHAHRGDETMVVLDGGFIIENSERETWRGEELISLDGSAHALIGLPGVPCIAAALIRGYADFK